MRALGGESETVVVWESLDSGGFPWSEHPQPGWVDESASTGCNEAGGQCWCWFVGVHPAVDRRVRNVFLLHNCLVLTYVAGPVRHVVVFQRKVKYTFVCLKPLKPKLGIDLQRVIGIGAIFGCRQAVQPSVWLVGEMLVSLYVL